MVDLVEYQAKDLSRDECVLLHDLLKDSEMINDEHGIEPIFTNNRGL